MLESVPRVSALSIGNWSLVEPQAPQTMLGSSISWNDWKSSWTVVLCCFVRVLDINIMLWRSARIISSGNCSIFVRFFLWVKSFMFLKSFCSTLIWDNKIADELWQIKPGKWITISWCRFDFCRKTYNRYIYLVKGSFFTCRKYRVASLLRVISSNHNTWQFMLIRCN